LLTLVQSVGHCMKNFDFRDFALRALIVLAGGIAAALFILKGQTSALPALAAGATLGVCAMTHYGPSAE
jgi:hypothetical protein